jgi:hypothetical protein
MHGHGSEILRWCRCTSSIAAQAPVKSVSQVCVYHNMRKHVMIL